LGDISALEKFFETNINIYQLFTDVDQEGAAEEEEDEEAALQEAANDPNREANLRELLEDAELAELIPPDHPQSPTASSDTTDHYSSDDDDHYGYRDSPVVSFMLFGISLIV
jgi:hypothetical protein